MDKRQRERDRTPGCMQIQAVHLRIGGRGALCEFSMQLLELSISVGAMITRGVVSRPIQSVGCPCRVLLGSESWYPRADDVMRMDKIVANGGERTRGADHYVFEYLDPRTATVDA